jgi:DMSO/TMAO reductase YedYZ heme-binding membrane subunit
VNASGLTWEIARAGGFVAYGLLTGSVAIGIIVSLKWRSPGWTRFVTTELHRFVTILALVFTALHTLMVAVDPFIRFTPLEVLVPLVSHYRPLWIALGIVGAYLLIAVYLSEWIRPHVGYAWWRRFHYLSFVAFVLALVHGLGTGSDSRVPWAIGVYAGSVVLIGALITVRAFPPNGERSHPIVAGVVGLVLAAGAFWAWQGPLQVGWNAIANDAHGSGGAILAGTGADPSTVPSQAPVPRQPFSDTIAGQLVQANDGSVALTATLRSSHDQLTLHFPSSQGGQLAVDGATVTLLAPDGDTCTGTVGGLTANRLTATCQGASSGSVWLLQLSLTGDTSGNVRGSIQATPQ